MDSCQVPPVLQFLAKDHRFEGQVMLTCFCRFVCLPFRNMYILKMMCTYNICEIKKSIFAGVFSMVSLQGPTAYPALLTHLITNKKGLYLAPSSHVSLLVVTTRRVPVQWAVERDEIPTRTKSTTRRCVPY